MLARDCSRQICGFAFKTNDNECTTVGSQRSREISYRRTLSRRWDDIAIAVVSRHYAVTYFGTGNRGCSSRTLRSRLRLAVFPFPPCFQPITIPLQLGSVASELLTPKTRDACVWLKCSLQNGRCVISPPRFRSCTESVSARQINSRGESSASIAPRAINYIVIIYQPPHRQDVTTR